MARMEGRESDMPHLVSQTGTISRITEWYLLMLYYITRAELAATPEVEAAVDSGSYDRQRPHRSFSSFPRARWS